jgi:hypothetical protein
VNKLISLAFGSNVHAPLLYAILLHICTAIDGGIIVIDSCENTVLFSLNVLYAFEPSSI